MAIVFFLFFVGLITALPADYDELKSHGLAYVECVSEVMELGKTLDQANRDCAHLSTKKDLNVVRNVLDDLRREKSTEKVDADDDAVIYGFYDEYGSDRTYDYVLIIRNISCQFVPSL